MANEGSFVIPKLYGNNEQRPWAYSVRLPVIVNLVEKIRANFTEQADQAAVEVYLEVLLGRYTSAKWWVEYEQDFAHAPLEEYFWNELSYFLHERTMQIAHIEAPAQLTIYDIGNTITNVPFLDREPLHILSGRSEAIHTLLQSGGLIAFCENRGEVPYGMRTEQQVWDEVDNILHALIADGYEMPFYTVCFACERPEKLTPRMRFDVHYATPEMLARRKPNDGMFQEAAQHYHIYPHEVDIVGDGWEDLGAARKFHARTFYDACVYFKEKVLPNPPAPCEKVFNW